MSAHIDRHPYREVWETRDLDSWRRVLAPDVTVWSPLLRKPFEGADEARELFRALSIASTVLKSTRRSTSPASISTGGTRGCATEMLRE